MASRGQHHNLWADGALLLVALVWGITFGMVKEAIQTLPPFAFLAVRFALATGLLALYAWVVKINLLWGARSPEPSLGTAGQEPGGSGVLNLALPSLVAGAATGTFLFLGYSFQTAGLLFTSASKAGFITGLSVAIVPVLAAILLRQQPGAWAVIGITLATSGLALLTLSGSGAASLASINRGDLLVLLCAFSFAGHIVAVGHFVRRHHPLQLAFLQVLIVSILSAAVAYVWERDLLVDFWQRLADRQVIAALLVTGVLATAIAFLVQNTMQTKTTPTHTALIFATEPVFAAIFAYLYLGERLLPLGLVGGILVVLGMVVAELRTIFPAKSPSSLIVQAKDVVDDVDAT